MPWAGNIAKTRRQTENSSLLPAKCWPLLHVNLSVFFKICFSFVLLYNKSPNDWSLGEQLFCLPRISMFPETRNKIHCSPRDQSLSVKGTVSQTAHVQVINQKWSNVFKFVICETKWRQQAEDNPHGHGGRRNNSGRKKFFLIPAAAGNRNGRSREEFDSKEISTSRVYRPNLKPRTVQQVTASSR